MAVGVQGWAPLCSEGWLAVPPPRLPGGSFPAPCRAGVPGQVHSGWRGGLGGGTPTTTPNSPQAVVWRHPSDLLPAPTPAPPGLRPAPRAASPSPSLLPLHRCAPDNSAGPTLSHHLLFGGKSQTGPVWRLTVVLQPKDESVALTVTLQLCLYLTLFWGCLPMVL